MTYTGHATTAIHVRRYCGNIEKRERPNSHLIRKQICQPGVSDATFRAACADLLSMSPGRYHRLRQLKSLRGELTHADPRTNDGMKVMKRYRFTDFHRFLGEYWQTFGSCRHYHHGIPRVDWRLYLRAGREGNL